MALTAAAGGRLTVHQTQHIVQAFGLREYLMQLLSVEAVLAHHFINELFRRRVIGEIAAHLHHVMLRLE
ncbi:Uncharacterised protein [Klebsiella michiganensis]|uniref:Uncharacterized protein n=1 Tax=Klebsiella michiganensis TaxID=1134687 RepID=A0A7H4PMP2_9ENTR|nr:Uncharacterised protein [Klebsiella michiganensis]